MITNTERRDFQVVEITNEMPINRIGGVGSVVEGLISGYRALGADVLWFVVDHRYRSFELEAILERFDAVAVGDYADLERFHAPVVHLHSYYSHPALLDYLRGVRSLFTIHSLLAFEETSNEVDLADMVRGQEALIAACDEVALVSQTEHDYYRELGYHQLNPRARVVHTALRSRGPGVARAGRRSSATAVGWCRASTRSTPSRSCSSRASSTCER